jgi:hypothetical protein
MKLLRFTQLKRSTLALIAGLILVAVPVATALVPQHAYAAGEVYTWDAGDKNKINVSGGSTGSLSGGGVVGNEVFAGGLAYQGRCYLSNLRLNVPNNTTGTFQRTPPGSGAGGGLPDCQQGDYDAFFGGGNVSIGGTRSGTLGGEPAGTRDAHINVTTLRADAPASLTGTLKKGNTVVGGGPIHINKTTNGGISGYNGFNFSDLDFGDYQFCVDPQIMPCQAVRKIRGQLFQATFNANEAAAASQIWTEVKLSFRSLTSSGDLTFGPYTINLLDKGGNDLSNSVQTDAFTVKAQHGDGTAQIINNVTLSAYTDGIAAGEYQVCLQGLNKCVPITKVDGSQAHAIIQLSSTESAAAVQAAQNGTPLGQGATKPTCESTDDNNAYLICPLFNGLSNFTDWMFTNLLEPFLYTAPISTSASDESFQVWSTFRIYGDIFLVIAVLVIVFGESIGGGFIDAYTAKRALPRVLAAAILINLSVYIVAFMVDATNIIGHTIGKIVLAPIDLTFRPPASVGDASIAGGIIGLIIGAGGIATVLVGLFTLKAAFIKAALYVAFFALLPIFLAIATVFMVLVLRKGLILGLILLSPIAFALYCLPATEKWFKRWWNMLFKSLMLYPAITLIYAVADVLAVSIMKANGATAGSIKSGTLFTAHDAGHALPHVANIFNFADTPSTTGASGAIIAFIVVLFVEGGIKFIGVVWVVRKGEEFTAGIFSAATNGAKRVNKAFDGRRELGKKRLAGQMVQNRERAYRAAGKLSGSGNAATRFLGRRMQNSIQGGGLRDIYGDAANYRAEQMKIAEAVNATGDDTGYRALTVNKKWALDHGTEGVDWRRNSSGGREFVTGAGNKWVSEGDVDAAYARHGNNQAALQWALGHEMDKATTQENQDHLRKNFKNMNYQSGIGGALGTSGWNMSDGEMAGMWTGAAFAKQNANREWKHYKWNNGDLQFDRLSAARELDEKKSPYELGQTNADTWTSMSQGVIDARRRHDQLDAKRQAPGGLTTVEQQQLRDDKEFLGRASRLAGRMTASGAMYGGTTAPNGQPIPMAAAPMQPGQAVNLQPGQPAPSPQQQQQMAALNRQRTEAAIGAGSISRTGEEQVKFTRIAEQYAPTYTGPAEARTATGSNPNIPAWDDTASPYGTQPGTEDSIEKRVGAGRRGPGQ